MLRVGLTGGVGSGKSKVADMLGELGARVSRSDDIGRALMQPGQTVMTAIAEYFGPSVVTVAGTLDRVKLAQIAFTDGRVEELNALVHPAVIAEQSRWMESVWSEDPDAVAVVESALIFETKHADPGELQHALPWRTRFDRIVVVAAPETLRRQRYIERMSASGATADESAKDFERRMRAQSTEESKVALADFVLQNDRSLDDLRAKAVPLYAALKQEALDRNRESM